MRILWLTWKDRSHPQAGGAEVVNEELARRLVRDGHRVIFVVGGYKGATHQELHPNGYEIVRLGNRYTVYLAAQRYYSVHLKGKVDLVIDEINTVPFFARMYVMENNVLFVHQLSRQIWFHQLPRVIGFFGYMAEPYYLRMLSQSPVITVSESTKQDLTRYGFREERISIIREGIELMPLINLAAVSKYDRPTLLSLGNIRSMKRTMDQVSAFELAKRDIPDLKLVVAGDASDAYGRKVMARIDKSPYRSDIELVGRVDTARKQELMQRSHLILQTAVKEGWGLTVTEAASQGTPAVAYDVDGLRDSIRSGETGVLRDANPESLAQGIVSVLRDKTEYERMRKRAWENSKAYTFDAGYRQFKQVLEPA